MQDSYLLAIDTAHQDCSVAVMKRDDPSSVVYQTETVGNGHAERILAMIDEVLAQAQIGKDALSVVAFGRGPGSFTGLRVACGIAQGLGWALGLKLAQVNNLEACALACAEAHQLPAGSRLAILNDARMHEVYAGVYRLGAPGERPQCEVPARLVKPEDLVAWLPSYRVDIVAGSALAQYQPELPVNVRVESVPGNMITALAALGWMDAKENLLVTPALAAPLYVRDRVALTMAQRAQGEKL